MKLSIVLENYEEKIKSIYKMPLSTMRHKRDREAWGIYKFLIKCGVSKVELANIEKKYNH